MPDQLTGPVEVVGTGMLGTSVGLACRRAGLDVVLSDLSPEHLRTASGLGAGRPRRSEDRPQLVVVAVPPDHLGTAIRAALDSSDATVTDVGSIKTEPLRVAADGSGLDRYVGSHPMAGSERSPRTTPPAPTGCSWSRASPGPAGECRSG
jgi:prephenate dehydrogenase